MRQHQPSSSDQMITSRSRIHEGRKRSRPLGSLQMYGVITTVPAPVQMYDSMHAEMIKRVGTSVDGLLVHVGRATPDGFQTVEVWESKLHFVRAISDVVLPMMPELTGHQPSLLIEQS